MSKNVVDPPGATKDVTVWRIRVACWISKATYTYARAHTRICNVYCFSTATIICERVSVLRFTYIICLIFLNANVGGKLSNKFVLKRQWNVASRAWDMNIYSVLFFEHRIVS